jgi:hypothetical protein
VRESATSILRQIEELEKWRAAAAARGHAATDSPATPGARPPTGPAPDPARRRMVSSYRRIAPGEERVEGELQQIECGAKSVAFVVKVAEGTARFDAPALDQIEFITYSDDFRGAINCGPLLGGPKRVYVTQAISADRKTSRVVAVEFLPKEK